MSAIKITEKMLRGLGAVVRHEVAWNPHTPHAVLTALA